MPPDQLTGIEPVRTQPRGVAAAERIEQFSRQLKAFEKQRLKDPSEVLEARTLVAVVT